MNTLFQNRIFRVIFRICFIIIILSKKQEVKAQPVINSFTPTSGIIGTNVSITGLNFNAHPDSNIVYFGAVRATVISASSTSLTVTTPAGTTYQPITITTGGLTAYSQKPFHVTFPGYCNLTSSIFNPRTELNTSGERPVRALGYDFDNDGRTDICITSFPSWTISIYRNISTVDSIKFLPEQSLNISAIDFGAGDINGDGKVDIILSTGRILLNTSTLGSISFTPTTSYFNGPTPIVNDLDLDGKPEIIYTNPSNGSIFILKNTSSGNTISFGAVIEILTGNGANDVSANDLDGDGRPDITVINGIPGTLSILRNTTTNGILSFAPKIDLQATNYADFPAKVAVGDMDNDGKQDIAIGVINTDRVIVYRNTSVPEAISFSAKIEYRSIISPGYLTLSEVDGDGWVDIVIGNGINSPGKLTVLKNLSSTGNISYNEKYIYDPGEGDLLSVLASDLDNDGKTDIAAPNDNATYIALFKNKTGSLLDGQTCLGGNTLVGSNIESSTYQWQQNTGSGYINISDNSTFTGTNTRILQIANIPSSWRGYRYRCRLSNGSYSSVTTLEIINHWIGTLSNDWENPANWSCGAVPDSNTNVYINCGSVVLNSNVSCRSLTVRPGASYILQPGHTLEILR